MLYCCNGAFKSGSTWLSTIVRALVGPGERLPERFAQKGRTNPGVPRNALLPFLAEADLAANDYLVKTHYGDVEARDALLAHPQVRVCGITRDLKDVVVSAYYHHHRLEAAAYSFAEFFRPRGLRIARRVHEYNQLWQVDHPRNFLTRYEALQTDGPGEIARLCHFLRIAHDADLIARVDRATSFAHLQLLERQQRGDAEPLFFRSGKSGDWRHHLDPEMAAAVDTIQSAAAKEFAPTRPTSTA